jgi:cytochrome P450
VLADPDTFSLERAWSSLWTEEFRAILEKDGGGFFPDAIMTDPPNHTRVPPLIETAFTARRIKQLEPAITRQAVQAIEGLADRDEADGVNELAILVTIRIMAEQLGVQDVDLATIDRWSTAFTQQIRRMLRPEEIAENARTVCACQHFIIDLMRQRREQPGEDLISDLIAARSEDERIFNRFVEELIHIAPPARATSRFVIRDTEIAGMKIPAGSLVMTMFAYANGDEAQFGHPREFDTERPNRGRQMGFRAGIPTASASPWRGWR